MRHTASSLTVCLLNWKRPGHLRRIIDRLAVQTLRPTIFLWNNSPEPLSHRAVDWQVDSARNVLCPPRWWMASQAETELVMSLDDDLMPGDSRVIEDAVAVALEQPVDRAVGPFGVILHTGGAYFPHRDARCPPQDTPVDLVQGRCLIVRARALREAIKLGDLCGNLGREDDIAVCGALANRRPRYHLVPAVFHKRMENLPEGDEALFRRPGHARRRDAARRHWFPS